MSKPQEKLKEEKKLREIIIKTDGNAIFVDKAEVAGNLELLAILQSIVNQLLNQKR